MKPLLMPAPSGKKFCEREREREKKCLFIFVLHSHADYKKLETVHSCPRGISSVFSPPVTFHHQLIENAQKKVC